MSLRPTRAKKTLNYAKLNSQGKQAINDDSFEEGQLVDSPLSLHPSEDDFNTEPRSAETVSIIDSQFDEGATGADSELDYNNILVINSDAQSTAPGGDDLLEDEAGDLGRDNVWEQQEVMLAANREKIEHLHKRLVRQKQLEQAKLIEEQERAELAKMQREICQIKQIRSVQKVKISHGTGEGEGST